MAFISRWTGYGLSQSIVGDRGEYIHDYQPEFESWVFVECSAEVAAAILKVFNCNPINKEFICIGAFDVRRSFLASHDGRWWIHNVSLNRENPKP